MAIKRKAKQNTKRNRLALLLLLLVGVISVGYAALSTALNINGTTKIKNAKWDVHLVVGTATSTGDVVVNNAPTLTAGTKVNGNTNTVGDTVEYSVDLVTPGDKYEFTVDVVNGGTIDAKLSSVLMEGVSTEQDVYTNYTVVYSGGDKDGQVPAANDVLGAGETVTVKVTLEFVKDITADQLPTTEQTMNLKFGLTYVQA